MGTHVQDWTFDRLKRLSVIINNDFFEEGECYGRGTLSYIQVNLAMSNLLISNTQPMSKWPSIPEHFPYIALYFKPVYVQLGYHEISAISKWFFIPEN